MYNASRVTLDIEIDTTTSYTKWQTTEFLVFGKGDTILPKILEYLESLQPTSEQMSAKNCPEDFFMLQKNFEDASEKSGHLTFLRNSADHYLGEYCYAERTRDSNDITHIYIMSHDNIYGELYSHNKMRIKITTERVDSKYISVSDYQKRYTSVFNENDDEHFHVDIVQHIIGIIKKWKSNIPVEKDKTETYEGFLERMVKENRHRPLQKIKRILKWKINK